VEPREIFEWGKAFAASLWEQKDLNNGSLLLLFANGGVERQKGNTNQ
jgi:hypothetical protein